MNDIGKYAAFFHDGSIIDINHIGNKMVISMASAEMDEEDFIASVFLGTESVHYYRLFRNGP